MGFSIFLKKVLHDSNVQQNLNITALEQGGDENIIRRVCDLRRGLSLNMSFKEHSERISGDGDG